MPPSGYTNAQADSVTSFLRSCSEALLNEAADRAEDVRAALAREIGDIARYIADERPSTATTSVLLLTQEFYKRLADRRPAPGDFQQLVESTLAEIRTEILKVHIPQLVS